MTTSAHGTFQVNIIPQPADEKAQPLIPLGRMLIEKQFEGDLVGTSRGQMLTGMTEVKGSGVYVAVERVAGSLHGRPGTFILYHLGLMVRGAPQLAVTVVPDSGTDELVGLTGSMNIINAEGKHSYDFAYLLAGESTVRT